VVAATLGRQFELDDRAEACLIPATLTRPWTACRIELLRTRCPLGTIAAVRAIGPAARMGVVRSPDAWPTGLGARRQEVI
jgi:hypothetical protein